VTGPMRHRSCRGWTLVDVTVVVAIVGIVAAMALPSYQEHLAKARRADAVAALTRLQFEQEQFRAANGNYALALQALRRAGSGASDQGHYRIALVAAHPQSYIARARTTDDSAVDAGCTELTLTVADGVASHGPTARCWNR
jgi:type IV pilus assembly protein PilE